VSQPVGEIKVRRGLETYGGKGESLVKGVVVNLSAIALSVKPGGSIERVQLGLSRASSVHTVKRNFTGDEGRSFKFDNQVLISSHRKLLWSKAMVVRGELSRISSS
jgi:hypothetical protein